MLNDADFFDFLVDDSHVYVFDNDYVVIPTDKKVEDTQ